MRLLTRSDFDGLCCAALLAEAGVADDIKFVHPKDVQDGKVDVSADDVLANVPYVPGCGLWFDHHSSEIERGAFGDFKGASDPAAPSAARVIYNHYGGAAKFTNPLMADMLAAADKADSARFTAGEILKPRGWTLLAFILDPRTGLARYRDYDISHYHFMMNMVRLCRTKSIYEILEEKDVKQRTARYFEQDELFREMLKSNSAAFGKVIKTDLRGVEEIYSGNRFLIYSLFPEQNISLQVLWGFQKLNTVITCGHSIITRTSNADVGSLMLAHGGGGHKKAGTCQVKNEDADRIVGELIQKLNA